ncbi:hypothetical protein [Aureimonas sp. ME7]|uniref:hypothetical protein n=1 Tax=Aureimonas sp. ME7 TaxID=2744252 RepID=UPI0015F6FD19|nr:hypothetical protein [Aureimonas sp. ME7]
MRAFLRFLIPIAAVIAFLGGAPSLRAEEAVSPDVSGDAAEKPPAAAESRSERLDRLFGELRREGDAQKAGALAEQIQTTWNESGSATIDLLMLRSAQAIAKKDAGAAMDLLDQAIVLQPDFAEGWNRRATLNYTQNRYGLSIADVGEVLKREPRHFGALMGLGAMLEELGRRREALDAYGRALAVYPSLKPAQDAVARLAEELSGQPA